MNATVPNNSLFQVSLNKLMAKAMRVVIVTNIFTRFDMSVAITEMTFGLEKVYLVL